MRFLGCLVLLFASCAVADDPAPDTPMPPLPNGWADPVAFTDQEYQDVTSSVATSTDHQQYEFYLEPYWSSLSDRVDAMSQASATNPMAQNGLVQLGIGIDGSPGEDSVWGAFVDKWNECSESALWAGQAKIRMIALEAKLTNTPPLDPLYVYQAAKVSHHYFQAYRAAMPIASEHAETVEIILTAAGF